MWFCLVGGLAVELYSTSVSAARVTVHVSVVVRRAEYYDQRSFNTGGAWEVCRLRTVSPRGVKTLLFSQLLLLVDVILLKK